MSELPFCECGCGERVTKEKNRFLLGHHSRVMDCTWNRGLTKETDKRVKKQAEKLIGRTKETHSGVKRQSEKMKDKIPWMKGKTHTDKSKKQMSKTLKSLGLTPWNKGKTKYNNKRMKAISKKRSGVNHPLYKGFGSGKYSNYDLYKNDISFCESIRRNVDNKNILEVRCSYCGRWYPPSTMDVINRKAGLKNDTNKFYCSDDCKNLCPIFRKREKPAGFEKKYSRNSEVFPEIRKIVFERDKWECQKCGSHDKLECHHIDSVSLYPILSNDIDSCITLCVKCHKFIHMKIEGCKYNDLKCKK